jgi:hypothetical protein
LAPADHATRKCGPCVAKSLVFQEKPEVKIFNVEAFPFKNEMIGGGDVAQ